VWIYDIVAKIWSKESYDADISRLYMLNGKLGIYFESDIDRKKSFDAPDAGIS
jgi:hypothetical protein